MTEKTVIECDGDWPGCDGDADPPLPQEWVTFDVHGVDEGPKHFCPSCGFKALLWGEAGKSRGPLLDIQHTVVDEDFERVSVHGDTLSLSVTPIVDEPPEDFPDVDFDETEGLGVHVFDHLHIYIVGGHKQEPLVVVDSDEFPTDLEVRDSEGSFEYVEVEEGLRLGGILPEDER